MPYLKLALDFPFNDRDGKQLKDFEYRKDDITGHVEITFGSTGASSEGFTLISSVQDKFDTAEEEAVGMLQSLAIGATEGKQIRLALQAQEMSPADQVELQKIIDRLPGGRGQLFPSIGKTEWSMYPLYHPYDRSESTNDLSMVSSPCELMSMSPPNLMVPLTCPLTFGSIQHFKVDHLTCATMSHWETETLLMKWAMCDHEIALYGVNGMPVIAMKFGPYPRNVIVDAAGIRLPTELQIQIEFSIPGVKWACYTAARDQYFQGGLPEHDAYFVITSHNLDWFQGQHSAPRDKPLYRSVRKVVPHPNNFFLESLANAMFSLEKPGNHKFHHLALGDSFDSLSPVDITLTSEISDATKESAWNWLMTYTNWNREQLELIQQLKRAKGGISLATGTAGAGKTTVQMAMAVYFVKMGGRAACFAASNTNVVTQADTLYELTKAAQGNRIRIVRIVSASRGIGFKYITATQAQAKRVGHYHGTVSTVWGLAFLLKNRRMGKIEPWTHTVEACILEEAEKRVLKLTFQYSDRQNRRFGRTFEAWEEMRDYLEASLTEQFWEVDENVRKYAQVFEACKGHLIGLADIVITTNSNAQCADLKRYWSQATNITRLGVFVDEVGKEQEINIWNALLSKGLPCVPDFVMLLGDPE